MKKEPFVSGAGNPHQLIGHPDNFVSLAEIIRKNDLWRARKEGFMKPNDSPHSLDPKPLPSSKPLTDADYAKSVFDTQHWQRNHQFMRFWELPSFVRAALRERGVDKAFDHPVDFENTVHRVTRIIRGCWTSKGVKKRRNTLLRKKQLELFSEFQ
jgi:hypothetical protein